MNRPLRRVDVRQIYCGQNHSVENDSVLQAPGVYTATDHPGTIFGTGSIKVPLPDLDGLMMIVR